MNFNIDDPLAGILSDGSDDSFFDDDILGKKKPAKKKSTPIADKKNTLFDLGDGDKNKPQSTALDAKKDSLFDLGITDSKKVSLSNDDGKISKESIKSPGSFKRTLSKESIKTSSTDLKTKPALDMSPSKSKISTSADKLDILGEFTETRKDTTKPMEKGKSSQSLLDDILGGSSTKTGSSNLQPRPVTTAKSQEFDFDSILNKNESKQTILPSKKGPQKQNVKVETAKDEAIVKKSKSSEDWLGIFQDKDGEDEEDDDGGMPAWLSGGSKKKKTSHDKKLNKPAPEKETPKEIQNEQENEEKRDTVPPYPPEVNVQQFQPDPKIITSTMMPQVHGNNEDITAEGATLYLQQQESQLMLALQLKAQEEKLATMQSKNIHA